MDRLTIIPVLTSHRMYLENADTSFLTSYTGASMKWIYLQDFLRSRSIIDFINVLKTYKTINAVQHTLSNINLFIMNAPRASVPIKIYRGTGDFKFGDVGETVVDYSVSGYSFEPEVAASFAKNETCCLYELTLPANSPFLYIGYISKKQLEYEVLMPAGTEFKIVGERWQEKQHIYTCEFVGIREDDIFSENPIETLRYDSKTEITLVSRINVLLNTYLIVVKYNKENAITATRNNLNHLVVVQCLNIIPIEKIVDIYVKSSYTSESNKLLLQEILAAPSASAATSPTKGGGKGKSRGRKTRRYLAKRKSTRTKKTRTLSK